MHTHTYTHIYIYMYTCVYIYMCIYIYIYIHTLLPLARCTSLGSNANQYQHFAVCVIMCIAPTVITRRNDIMVNLLPPPVNTTCI